MVNNITTNQAGTRTNTRYLKGDPTKGNLLDSGTLYKGTAAAPTGKVGSGQIMGRVSTVGADFAKLRPCGLSTTAAAVTSATQTFPAPPPFRVGDVVDSFQSDNLTSLTAALVVLSVDKITGVVVFDASITGEVDAIYRRSDGSEAAIGILWGDHTSYLSADEDGEPTHITKGVTFWRKAWVDWRYVVGTNVVLLAELIALGFTVDNQ